MKTTKQKQKGFLALVSLAVTMAMLTACGGAPSGSSAPGSSSPGSETKAPGTEWAEEVGLNKTETVDELYEKAKKEGKVVVYSQSSRIKDVKATFEKQYPGVEVEAYHMGTNDVVEKVIREQGAGVFHADVAFLKESAGTVTNEILAKGMMHPYKPTDLTTHMIEPYKTERAGLVPYVSLRAFYYNTEAYKSPPIDSWWDLTKPEWKGKVILEDPTISADTMDLFLAVIANPQDMEQAYKEEFGKDIELDGTENASYEFFKRLLANDLILVKSSDEAVEAVGAPGQSSPPIAISASSKQRDIKEKGLKVAVTYDIKPKVSVAGESYLYIINKAPHPNAGKLLIRWMAGEADGKAEGFKPYNVQGSWSTRTDNGRDDQPPLDQLNVWPADHNFFYQNFTKFRDFWMSNQ